MGMRWEVSVWVLHVSILTRPEGRVLRVPTPSGASSARCFNPHPARRPGATCQRVGRNAGPAGFNPHPARRPGATGKLAVVTKRNYGGVSILTRPEGRVLRSRAYSARLHPDSFNPHPARRPGATYSSGTRAGKSVQFQSSPGPKAGCYGRTREPDACDFRVSILTRPEGRVLHSATLAHFCESRGFNPHPARRPGATRGLPHPLLRDDSVSILTRPEGRVLPVRGVQPVQEQTFQSSPGPKAGCYLAQGAKREARRRVSILTRPEGRVLHMLKSASVMVNVAFQSSPGPKAGCYAGMGTKPRMPSHSFNPHPARRPGATWERGIPCRRAVFQSSPGPKAGCYPAP